MAPDGVDTAEPFAVPLWLGILVLACLPATARVLWRMGRWWVRAEPFPLPLDRAWPAVRWSAGFGVALFGGMFVLVMATAAMYQMAVRAGLVPWEPLDVPAMFSPGVFLAQVLPPAVGLVLVAGFGRGAGETVGLRVGPVCRTVLHGLAAFAAALPLCVAALWVNAMAVLHWTGGKPLELHPLLQTIGRTKETWAIGLALFQAGLLASLAEEFMYRGVLLVSLMREVGAAWALVVSSAVFALAHLATEPQAVLPLFVLGLAMGYAAYRTRSLLAPVVTHSLFNTVMLLGAFYGGP